MKYNIRVIYIINYKYKNNPIRKNNIVQWYIK